MRICTILEGEVAEENWEKLRAAYREVTAEKAELGPLQSFLLQDAKRPTMWKIISIWKDRETLEKMRSSGEVPAGVRVFRMAASEPTLSILTITEEL